MDHQEIRFKYTVHHDTTGLSVVDQSLLKDAFTACQSAYAPYSKFKVGVAIRTIDNEVILGSNQENGAYPIGQCAERVALYNLVHTHGRKAIDTIAIMVENATQQSPASPCGSCRQILNEYRSQQDQPIRLLLGLSGSHLVYEISDVKDLLPLAFDGSFLGL